MNKNMRKMYTEEEIVNLIKENSDVAIVDSLINKDVKVKTIEQSQANWVSEITFTRDGSGTVEFVQKYSRMEVVGNVLFVVLNCSLTNNGESSVSMGTIKSSQIELPEEIASKIYDFTNKPLTEPAGSGKEILIAMQNANVVDDVEVFSYSHNLALSPKIGLYHVGNATPKLVRVYLTRNSIDDVNIPSGATYHFTARLFLTLL